MQAGIMPGRVQTNIRLGRCLVDQDYLSIISSSGVEDHKTTIQPYFLISDGRYECTVH